MKNLKLLVFSALIVLIFSLPQKIVCMEQLPNDPSEQAKPTKQLQQCTSEIESIKDEAIYQRFLKGVLVYRPREGSEVGRIDLPIAALENPLEGTFDLSQCGDVGKHLSISTGYCKGRRAENANKVEIWIAPRFLIEKELNSTAGHFKDIFPNWRDTNPIGIFWTWGGWNDLGWYDYLTTQNYDELSNGNLYEKWCAGTTRGWHGFGGGRPLELLEGRETNFMFIL